MLVAVKIVEFLDSRSSSSSSLILKNGFFFLISLFWPKTHDHAWGKIDFSLDLFQPEPVFFSGYSVDDDDDDNRTTLNEWMNSNGDDHHQGASLWWRLVFFWLCWFWSSFFCWLMMKITQRWYARSTKAIKKKQKQFPFHVDHRNCCCCCC